LSEGLPMKNVQVIDGARNATFSIFQATDAEFALIFPNDQDMELAEDVFERLGERGAAKVLSGLWERPVLKRDANGIHGTLFYDWSDRRDCLPASKREADWDEHGINAAQRRLFAQHR
jgi:hypothetical protein